MIAFLTRCCFLFAAGILAGTNMLAQEAPRPAYSDSVLAVINDKILTVFDVTSETSFMEERELKKYSKKELQQSQKAQEEYAQASMDLRIRAANRIVDDELIYAEFLRNEFTIPRSMVDERINRYVMQLANGDMEAFKERLRATEMTLSGFRQRMEKKIAVDMMLSSFVYHNLKVSPREITAYYRENIAKFSRPTRVRIQLLELRPGSAVDMAKSKSDVEAALRKGEDFSNLVKKYSSGPAKSDGGLLDWQDLNSIHEAFRETVSALEKGGTSSSVKLDESIFWLHMADREEGRVVPLGEVRKEISEILSSGERDRRYREYVRKLSSKSYLKTYYH